MRKYVIPETETKTIMVKMPTPLFRKVLGVMGREYRNSLNGVVLYALAKYVEECGEGCDEMKEGE